MSRAWLKSQIDDIKSTDDPLYVELTQNIATKVYVDHMLEMRNKDPWDDWEVIKTLLFQFCEVMKRMPKNQEKYEGHLLAVWVNSQKTKIRATQKMNISYTEDPRYIRLSQHPMVKDSLDRTLSTPLKVYHSNIIKPMFGKKKKL
jgi:hypothetical protein